MLHRKQSPVKLLTCYQQQRLDFFLTAIYYGVVREGAVFPPGPQFTVRGLLGFLFSFGLDLLEPVEFFQELLLVLRFLRDDLDGFDQDVGLFVRHFLYLFFGVGHRPYLLSGEVFTSSLQSYNTL